ncbi:MAG TPA: 30S ribosomal protein S2 [Verrucomicrobiae bacterium]|nr:30S ribosomal protein S2 [Verrucomicrobiae bacterium]
MANVTVEELLEAGVHFGHQTKRWNPKMKKYIFAARNGIHIVDLNKTLTQIEVACGFLHDIIAAGGTVLLVGTKKQAQQEIKDAAARTGMPYVVDRWLGGTLTNLRTIRNSVKRMQEIDRLLTSPEGERLPKKEVAFLRREHNKLHRNLDGIVNMERLPAAVFVIDILRETIALHEAQRLKIPLIAIVDTNCDPDQVTYPIAGNDDAIRAIKLVTNVIANTIAEAQAELGRKYPAPPPAPEAQPSEPVAEQPAAATS